jgi:hypothetical protein
MGSTDSIDSFDTNILYDDINVSKKSDSHSQELSTESYIILYKLDNSKIENYTTVLTYNVNHNNLTNKHDLLDLVDDLSVSNAVSRSWLCCFII